jgi:hypothetical protein
LKATKDGVSIADFYHNKVGCPGDEAEIEFFKEGVEPIATGIGYGDRLFHVFRIGQACEGGDLGWGGGIEGLAGFLQDGGDGGVGESVSDAKSG